MIPLDKLRWTTCSHVEADEAGAINEWLAAAPNATPAHGQVGINIWVTDMANRAPRALKNDEVIDLGGKKVRWLDTPHVPHNWDAGADLRGDHRHAVQQRSLHPDGPVRGDDDGDIVDAAIATEKAIPYMPSTPQAEPTLRRLAALEPKTIALMHGPASRAMARAALTALADHYAAKH